MRKLLVLSLLVMFTYCGYCEARTQYDSTGRNIVVNDTIRGRHQAQEAKKVQQQKMQAAAAAKLDYEAALKSLDEEKPKTNYYQDRIKK